LELAFLTVFFRKWLSSKGCRGADGYNDQADLIVQPANSSYRFFLK
jgi:hypothetical protein